MMNCHNACACLHSIDTVLLLESSAYFPQFILRRNFFAARSALRAEIAVSVRLAKEGIQSKRDNLLMEKRRGTTFYFVERTKNADHGYYGSLLRIVAEHGRSWEGHWVE